MEIIAVKNKITDCIALLEKARGVVQERGQQKASTNADYEKSLAKTIVQLKAGVEFDIEGVKVLEKTASNVERIAKGIIWEKALARDVAESNYKSAIMGLDTVMAELNAWQSIFRSLDNA